MFVMSSGARKGAQAQSARPCRIRRLIRHAEQSDLPAMGATGRLVHSFRQKKPEARGGGGSDQAGCARRERKTGALFAGLTPEEADEPL